MMERLPLGECSCYDQSYKRVAGSAWKLWPDGGSGGYGEAGGPQAHAANTIPPNPTNRQDGRLT